VATDTGSNIEVANGRVTVTRTAYNDIDGWHEQWADAAVEDVLDAIWQHDSAAAIRWYEDRLKLS
jgi:hypothetical protein